MTKTLFRIHDMIADTKNDKLILILENGEEYIIKMERYV